MYEEIWKPVVGFEGRYMVSNYGRVRTLLGAKREYGKHPEKALKYLVLRQKKDRWGYFSMVAHLRDKTGKNYLKKVHILVTEAFIPNDDPTKTEVNHIDGNSLNNVVWNLEWVSRHDNMMHAVYTGLKRQCIPVRLINPEGNCFDYPSKQEASRGIGRNEEYVRTCLKDHRAIRSSDGILYTLEFLDKEQYFSEQKLKYIKEHTRENLL